MHSCGDYGFMIKDFLRFLDLAKAEAIIQIDYKKIN